MLDLDTAREFLKKSPSSYTAARAVYHAWNRVSARVRGRTIGEGSVVLTDVQSLDRCLADIEKRCQTDTSKLRAELVRISYRHGESKDFEGLDPFSVAYRDQVIELQARMHGKSYHTDREGFEQADIEQRVRWQTPYGQPASVVGAYLIGYGFLIQAMNLPLGSRVLEIGCGEGGLSYQFAKAGYNLTCIEVSPSSAEITRRALTGLETEQVRITVLNSDVMSAALEGTFDAIVFYESFHHMPDHFKLLEWLKPKLAPGGLIAFGAEPIFPAGTATVPYPWGLRCDGESLRAIRNFGWMELGFTWPYFDEMMKRLGFVTTRMSSKDSQWSDVVIARLAV